MSKYTVVKPFTHRLTGEKFKAGQEFPEGYPQDSIDRLLEDSRGAFLKEVTEKNSKDLKELKSEKEAENKNLKDNLEKEAENKKAKDDSKK